MTDETKGLRTWIEVSKDAIQNNYNQFRNLIKPECKLMAVAKSNAYGHGLIDFSREMQNLGADWIGVDSITEASRLRKEGIAIPILVLGYTLPENFEEAAENNISLTISTFESLEALKHVIPDLIGNPGNTNLDPRVKPEDDSVRRLKIHIKIDTGMHRQGFQLNQIEKAARYIKENLPDVEVEGIYTHFAAAKDPVAPQETTKQIEEFKKAVEIVESFGLKPIKHAAATGGAIVFPESHFDMVRIGIGLYGLWPSSEAKAALENKINLSPVLTWKTIISEVKNVKSGERIGYDFTEALNRDSRIAILPIGYWHGYRRNLSSIASVIIKGQKAKVLGRVSMDMITIDVTDIPDANVGDEAILLGQDISAYELAKLSDTSWYETITQINPLIKRIYQD